MKQPPPGAWRAPHLAIALWLFDRHPLPACPLPHPAAHAADLMLFTVIADISILTLNLSLMLNTVSFYQVGGWVGGQRLLCVCLLLLLL